MASRPRLKTAFKKSKTIGPLHTGGPIAITKDGSRLITCVGEQVLCTDIASGTELCRFKGDNSPVTSLAVSPSSTHLAVFYGSLSLRIYSLPTTSIPSSPTSSTTKPNLIQPLRIIPKCHDAPIHVCRIDPSSTLLASGSADGIVKVWDIQRGYVTHMYKGHGGVVSALAFCYPRETSTSTATKQEVDTRMWLITGSADTRIRIFDLTATAAGSGSVSASGGAKTKNSSAGAGGKAMIVLEGHVSVPRGLDVTPDGRWLVSGGRDAVAMIWDLTASPSSSSSSSVKYKPKLIKTIPVLERIEALGCIVASEDVAPTSLTTKGEKKSTIGRLRFYTGGDKGVVRVWDATDAEVIASFGEEISSSSSESQSQSQESREILDVIYTPHTHTISSLHNDQNIFTYSLPLSTSSRSRLVRQHIGFNDEIIDSCLLGPSLSSSSPTKAPQILALATNSPLIRLYNTSTLNARLLPSSSSSHSSPSSSSSSSFPSSTGHTDMVLALDSSSDGSILVSASKDRSARVWMHHSPGEAGDELDWRCVAIAEGHAESVGAIVLSRSSTSTSTFMFTGSQDRTVKMWDLSTLPSPSSSSILKATEEEGGEREKEVLKLKSLLTLKAHDKDINALDVSPNDRFLATASQDKTVNVYEISYTSSSKTKPASAGALKLQGTLKGHKRGVWSVRFSRTERVVVTGSGDKSVRLWSLDDFSCLKTFEGHTNTVLRVDFISQGHQLVSSASDGLVKVWNVKDEECVTSLDGHEDKIWALTISQDENTIISGAADSVITFWTDCTEEIQVEKENARAELILKEQDFQNYVSIKDYRSAILLALSLSQPHRLLSLFTSLRSNSNSSSPTLTLDHATSITGSAAVDTVIATLPSPNLVKLLTFVRDWNTSARTSPVAQCVLHAVLKYRSAEDILKAFEKPSGPTFIYSDDENEDGDGEEEKPAWMKKTSQAVPKIDLKELIDGLLPYTERHLARADKLVQDSFVVDYILGEMDMGLVGEAATSVFTSCQDERSTESLKRHDTDLYFRDFRQRQ